MEAPEIVRTSLKDFLSVIFKRKALILLFFVVTFATVAIGTILTRPVYEAHAQFLVKIGRESIYVPATSGSSVINANRREQINSEVEILKSGYLAKATINLLGPSSIYPKLSRNGRGFLSAIFSGAHQEKTPVEKVLLKFQHNLDVQGIKKSNVIEISFRHTDPQMAARVVNTLANLYFDRHVEVYKIPHSYKFFKQQSEYLKNKLGQAEKNMQQLKNQHDVTALDQQQGLLLQQIAALHTSFNETRSLQVEKENRIKQLGKQLVAVPKTISQGEEVNFNPYLINTLETRLVELQLKEKNLLTKYTEQSRRVQNVRDNIRIVQQRLKQRESKLYGTTSSGINPVHQHLQEELLRNQADLKALDAKSTAQQNQLSALQNHLNALNKIEVQHDQLEQKVEVDRKNYRLYLTKFEESRISDAMDSEKMTSVSLIEPALVPLKPVSPMLLLNLVFGIFLGAFGGLGLAFFMHYLDDSLETVEEVEAVLQLPVLASIPELN